MRITRVGARHVYSPLTTTAVTVTLQVILWAYVEVHTPLGWHWKIFIINFLTTCLIFSHYSSLWALVCDRLGLFDVWFYFLFWVTLCCLYHYLQFQCSLSPHYSWELYHFFFPLKHLSMPNFSIKSSSTTPAHGEPSFSGFYRSYVLGHLFYAQYSAVCHYLPFYVHVLSSSLDSMCPEHLVFHWGLKWPH